MKKTNAEVMSVAILIVLCLSGWLIYRGHQDALSSASMKLVYHNAHWKTATLTYEKITYQYPSNWKLINQSQVAPKRNNYCAYPGHDIVTLESPSGSQVDLDAGQVCPTPLKAEIFGATPTIAFGKPLLVS
jgi:hypothetical protein